MSLDPRSVEPHDLNLLPDPNDSEEVANKKKNALATIENLKLQRLNFVLGTAMQAPKSVRIV
ncbi:hypothetical protein [Noviherbaspirillum saxi]|uniref:Uncharacterized protein n=1 Tax=Noviherbaspirillum saxi TaxID=2320863 RepID=A0A3A3FFM5_9BURK|nr:hypothetical protein [Noviherbaspirillum saxi]RJF92156.1 hypothetical protein D3871_26295 [Noviherbaspirillum saxi]